MRLGKVVGQVVSTAKDPSLHGLTLLIVQPLLAPGEAEQEPFTAADLVGAGPGEVVLCVLGSGARTLASTQAASIDCAIVAIADSVIVSNTVVYSK
jgi:microcompartment protein CcmK/EutM